MKRTTTKMPNRGGVEEEEEEEAAFGGGRKTRRRDGLHGRKAMGLTKSSQWRLHGDELIELVECTGLNPSILRRWHREFLTDFPRGFFTREEMKVVFGSMFPDGHPNAFMDIVFNAMDKRRIGYVTFRDFVKTIAITVSGTADDKLNWAFDVFDQKGDGFVTLDEMINVVEALWQLHGESPEMEDYKIQFIRRRTRKIFQRLDAKKDGRISRDQFREVLKQDPWIVKNVLHVYSSAMGAFSRVVHTN